MSQSAGIEPCSCQKCRWPDSRTLRAITPSGRRRPCHSLNNVDKDFRQWFYLFDLWRQAPLLRAHWMGMTSSIVKHFHCFTSAWVCDRQFCFAVPHTAMVIVLVACFCFTCSLLGPPCRCNLPLWKMKKWLVRNRDWGNIELKRALIMLCHKFILSSFFGDSFFM